MSKILGKDVTLSILIDASPSELDVIGCSRAATLITNAVTAGKSTRGSGVWQEFTGISLNWSVSVNGLATIHENLSIADLRALQFALAPVVISFKEVVGTNITYYSGTAIITSVQTSGNYADAETYDVQLLGTGELMQGNGNVYGNAPTQFYLASVSSNDPSPGLTTLGFTWSHQGPPPDSYTMRIRDTTTGITTHDTGIAAESHSVVVDSTHSYSFAVKSVYIGLGDSLYCSSIFWP